MTSFQLIRTTTLLMVAMAILTAGCVTAEKPATQVASSQVLRTTHQLGTNGELRDPAAIKPAGMESYSAPVYVNPRINRTIEVHPEWIPLVKPRAWRYIVIHHSATPNGSAAKFDLEHRAKGWDELGYHFVIDNGMGGPDGRLEIGARWHKQKHGAHAKTPDERFNQFGIGICLVGNFDNTRPTPAQYRELSELVAWLQDRYGIPSENIVGHNDTKPTACPGKNLNVASIRAMANQILVSQKQAPIATASH